MVDRRDLGSWLEGPGAAAGRAQAYPGERLGRPESGPGSVARFGRRLGGVTVDWLIALLIARALLGDGSFEPLIVFLAEHLLLVGTVSATIGHRLFGLGVETLDGAPAGPLRAVGRALLLGLAVPALIWDADQRGLHDRAVGTVVVRR
jgi:uncharacterized RDD family membrane protein YckC